LSHVTLGLIECRN